MRSTLWCLFWKENPAHLFFLQLLVCNIPLPTICSPLRGLFPQLCKVLLRWGRDGRFPIVMECIEHLPELPEVAELEDRSTIAPPPHPPQGCTAFGTGTNPRFSVPVFVQVHTLFHPISPGGTQVTAINWCWAHRST